MVQQQAKRPVMEVSIVMEVSQLDVKGNFMILRYGLVRKYHFFGHILWGYSQIFFGLRNRHFFSMVGTSNQSVPEMASDGWFIMENPNLNHRAYMIEMRIGMDGLSWKIPIQNG